MTKINTGNLIPVETLTTRYINQRKSPSFNKTVPKIKKDDFILDGWEEVPSKLKKSVRIKKDKNIIKYIKIIEVLNKHDADTIIGTMI